jgi:hypothetical protein
MKKTRILFITANPTDKATLKIDEELRQIKMRIRSAEFRESFEIESATAVRPNELLGLLNQHKPHIVHFSGHGSDQGEILLVDDAGKTMPVSPDVLAKVFSTVRDNVKMVVLNACYSDVQAKAINQVIDYVVGMSDEIGDKAAIGFASALYGALGYNRTIQNAFDQAIAGLLIEDIRDEFIPKLLVKPGATADKPLNGALKVNPPSSPLTKFVHDIRKRRLSVSLIGVVVLIGAVVSTYRIDPENLQAQLASGAIGIIVIIFGQLFYFLEKIREKDRAKVLLGMFIICAVLILALTAFTVRSLRDATIALDKPKVIDLRTMLGPDYSIEDRMKAKAVLTAPFLYKSLIQPSKTAIVESEMAEITLAKEVIEFQWRHFVNQNIEKDGWLGIDTDAYSTAIRSGETVHHETLFIPKKTISWRDVVAALDDPLRDTLIVSIKALVGNSTVTTQCKADLTQYRKDAAMHRSKNGSKPFMRATIPCI